MQRHIAADDDVCEGEVPRWYEEEFTTLEGALLWRGGAVQLPELVKVNPWGWYISFKLGEIRPHLPDDRERLALDCLGWGGVPLHSPGGRERLNS